MMRGPGHGHTAGFREWLAVSEHGLGVTRPPRQKDYFWHVHRKVSTPRPDAWDPIPSPTSRPMHIKIGHGTVALPAGTLVAVVDSSSDASPDRRKGYSGQGRDKWVTFRVVGNEPDKDQPEVPRTRTGVVSRYFGKEFSVPQHAYHMALQPPMSSAPGGAPPAAGAAPTP